MREYHILYPENRWVDANKIHGWFNDALADGLVLSVDPCPELSEELDIMAMALDHIRHITLAGDPLNHSLIQVRQR